MRFTKITKVVDELSAQQQYNKSRSTRIMKHSTKLAGRWFKTGKTKYFFADGSNFWSFDCKSDILQEEMLLWGSLRWSGVGVAFLPQFLSSLFISSAQIPLPSQELVSTVHWRMH